MSNPIKYAIVGTGGRCRMFIDAILNQYAAQAELVGFCDRSATRMQYHNAENLRRFGAKETPAYLAEDFDRMIRERSPDVVIVTTVDCFHHEYIVRALRQGCDVITEKPMTIDAPKANEILDAVQSTRRSLRVSFNYRYMASMATLKQLMLDGAVGKPLAVDFAWMLDTHHGADYFRRWHREKDKSGGLLIHKASHHFDLINWWIDSFPKRVFCMGDLQFYGKENAESRGERYSYSRYTGQPEAKGDPFALVLDSKPSLAGLYLNAEKDSGYIRDRNVMGEPITIEDTMALTARYRNGVILSYSLIAYSPWEGLRVSITGTKGRVELFEHHSSHIIAGQSNDELAKEQNLLHQTTVRHYPMFQPPRDIPILKATGAHGGGDSAMLERIFNPSSKDDVLARDASHIDGAASILMGIAANQSIATGLPVNCDELIRLP